MSKMLKPIVGALPVETLHCNVSTVLMALLLCGFQTSANAGLKDGWVAHWSFDDCTAKDISGNG